MIQLRRGAGEFARVGHRGASALAQENSLEALELAVRLGCDMLEFDVLPRDGRTVVVAHDRSALTVPGVATLDEVLELCAERLPGIALQVDLKRRGVEGAVVDALRRFGLLERSWVSGFDAGGLRRIAALEPELTLSFTLPRDRFGMSM